MVTLYCSSSNIRFSRALSCCVVKKGYMYAKDAFEMCLSKWTFCAINSPVKMSGRQFVGSKGVSLACKNLFTYVRHNTTHSGLHLR